MKIKNKTAGHAGIACFSFALKGNRAGSPHFKIVRFKWWEHVTSYLKVNNDILNEISITRNLISKEKYAQFEKTIHRLYEFLHIFCSDHAFNRLPGCPFSAPAHGLFHADFFSE